MGENDIKEDIYNVMTSSRNLTNYCQESVKSFKNKSISKSLDNFHLNKAIDFITKSLINEDQLFSELNQIDFHNSVERDNKPVYNKVIDYIEKNL